MTNKPFGKDVVCPKITYTTWTFSDTNNILKNKEKPKLKSTTQIEKEINRDVAKWLESKALEDYKKQNPSIFDDDERYE